MTEGKDFISARKGFYNIFYTNKVVEVYEDGTREEQELHWQEVIYNEIAKNLTGERAEGYLLSYKDSDKISYIKDIIDKSIKQRLIMQDVKYIISMLVSTYEVSEISQILNSSYTLLETNWPSDTEGVKAVKFALAVTGLKEVFKDLIPQDLVNEAEETLKKHPVLAPKQELTSSIAPEKPNKPEEKNLFLDPANKAKVDGDFNELLQKDRDLIHLTKEQAAKACKPQREAKELGLLELRFLAKLRKKCKVKNFFSLFKGDTEAEQKQNMNAYFEERFQERDRARDEVYKERMEGIYKAEIKEVKEVKEIKLG